MRVERLMVCAAGVGLEVGVGEAGVAVGVELGVGVDVGVGEGVPEGETVVDAVAELLPGLGSVEPPANAEAVLLSGPASRGVTAKVTVAVLKAGRMPS